MRTGQGDLQMASQVGRSGRGQPQPSLILSLLKNLAGSPLDEAEADRLAVSFHQVVHPVLSEEAGVAKLQHLLGGPDERSSECPAHAAQSSRTGAAGGVEGQTPKAVAAAFGVTVK